MAKLLRWHEGYHTGEVDSVGLFRVILRGEIVFIGQPTALPGGLAKRLADLSSARRSRQLGTRKT